MSTERDRTTGTRARKVWEQQMARLGAMPVPPLPVGPIEIDLSDHYETTVDRILIRVRCRCGSTVSWVVTTTDDEHPVLTSWPVKVGRRVLPKRSDVLDDDTRHHTFEHCDITSVISERVMVGMAVEAVANGETATINVPRRRLR